MKIDRTLGAIGLTALAMVALPIHQVAAVDDGSVLSANPNGSTLVNSATGSGDIGIAWKAGSLVLQQVPNFDFGTHFLGEKEDYQLNASGATVLGPVDATGAANTTAPTKIELGRMVVVTDQRATRSGWQLTVGVAADGDKMKNTAGTSVLTGATLDLKPAATIPFGIWTAFTGGGQSGSYFAKSTLGNSNGINGASISGLAVGSASAPQPIMSMPTDGSASAGSYALDFTDPTSATLHVPLDEQKVDTFTGKLTWTLQSPIAH